MYFESVDKTPNSGVGAGINDKIIIFDWDDVLKTPDRIDEIVMEESLVFKPNAWMITIGVTEDSIKNSSKDEGDNDATAVMQEVSAAVPGNKEEFRKLVASLRGRKLGIIHRFCGTNDMDLYGSPCAPLKFSNEFAHDKDNKRNTFTAKSLVKGPDVAIYRGSLNFENNPVLAPDAANVDLSLGSVFDVGINTVDTSITSISNANHGDKFSLIGHGSTNLSSIAQSAVFLLRDGLDWQGLEGSVIQFKVFNNGTNLIAIEQSRI